MEQNTYNLRQRGKKGKVIPVKKTLIVKHSAPKSNIKRVHIKFSDNAPVIEPQQQQNSIPELNSTNELLKATKDSFDEAVAKMIECQNENDALLKEKTALMEKFKVIHGEMQQIKEKYDNMSSSRGYMSNGVVKHIKHAWNFYNMIGLSANNAEYIEKSTLESVIKKLMYKCHPDKTQSCPESTELFQVFSFIKSIFESRKRTNRYNQLLNNPLMKTYIPHGGINTDFKAMEDYLNSLEMTYLPYAKYLCNIVDLPPINTI